MTVAARFLYALLATVAVAAAVLSFAALRDLALLCGFTSQLAWLLPVVVDAGAAAGTLVWLGRWAPREARRFACALALVLLASSVAANALSHGLEAYQARPAWWVVVLVSAVAPAVLGAVVHLAVLVGRNPSAQVTSAPPAAASDLADLADDQETEPHAPETIEQKVARLVDGEGYGRLRLARALGVSESAARDLLTAHQRRQEGTG